VGSVRRGSPRGWCRQTTDWTRVIHGRYRTGRGDRDTRVTDITGMSRHRGRGTLRLLVGRGAADDAAGPRCPVGPALGAPGCCWWPRRSWSSWRWSRRCCSAALGCAMNRTSGGCAGRWPTRVLPHRGRGVGARRVTGLLGAAAPWFVLLLVHGAGRHRVAGRAVVRCGRGVRRFPRRQVSRCMPGDRVAATPRPPRPRGSV
jgi:hypothetical protein